MSYVATNCTQKLYINSRLTCILWGATFCEVHHCKHFQQYPRLAHSSLSSSGKPILICSPFKNSNFRFCYQCTCTGIQADPSSPLPRGTVTINTHIKTWTKWEELLFRRVIASIGQLTINLPLTFSILELLFNTLAQVSEQGNGNSLHLMQMCLHLTLLNVSKLWCFIVKLSFFTHIW